MASIDSIHCVCNLDDLDDFRRNIFRRIFSHADVNVTQKADQGIIKPQKT